MAVVYRVHDQVNGRTVALKQLQVQHSAHAHERSALFEREFHLLAQLAHPRIIEVYDYGIDARAAYKL
jgi:serine/threonine protein kinase